MEREKGVSAHASLDHARVMGVLDEYIKKLRFLDLLKTKMTSDINMIQGEEMKRLLQEQAELEKQYADRLEQAEQLKGLDQKSELRDVKREIDELEKKIKDNTKAMWKILKDNPDVAENREKIERNKKDLINVLDKAYRCLNAGSLEEYKAYIEVEKEKLERLEKLKVEEKELNKVIKETTQELQVQRADFSVEAACPCDSSRRSDSRRKSRT